MSPRLGLWLLGSALGLSLLLNIVLLTTRAPIASTPRAEASPPARAAAPASPLAQPDPAQARRIEWREKAIQLAIRDFDAAVKSLDARPPEIPRDIAILNLASGVCRDRLDRLNEMLSKVPAEQREALWQITFDYWAAQNPEALRDFARTLPSGEMKTNAYRHLMEELTKSGSLDEALAVYVEMPVSRERQGVTLERLARAMAGADPEAALAWAQKLPTPEEKNLAIQMVISGAQEKLGMERLSALANTSTDPAMQMVCVQAMASLMNEETSAPTAIQWVQNLPKSLRYAAVSRLRERFAEKDPEEWSSLFLLLDDPSQRGAEIGNLAGHLTKYDPLRAAKFAASFQDPADQEAAARSLLSSWNSSDSTAAENWVNSLPPGQFKDSALLGLAWSADFRDPKVRLSIVDQISDPERRKAALKRFGR
jgi:hypothetical protein